VTTNIVLTASAKKLLAPPNCNCWSQGAGASSRQLRFRSNCIHSTSSQTSALVVVLFVLASFCASQTAVQNLASDSGPRTLRGTVVNGLTQEPISRALVYSAGNRLATLTDSEGHFEITPPVSGTDNRSAALEGQPRPLQPTQGPSASYWLMARKPGFFDDPNERKQVSVLPGREVTLYLIPEALIQGRVLFSTGEAAVGVSVQIFSRQVQEGVPRWMPAASVQSNSNGEFRFAELLPGAYKVVTHELMDNDPAFAVPDSQSFGFAPVYYPGVADFAAAGTIQLAAGQTFQADLSILRQPYYAVRIPVVSGNQNAGMNITVSPQGHRGPGYSLGYKMDKQAIEGQLPNGNYVVEATTREATGAINIAVADGPANSPAMTLIRNASIVLNVREEFSSTDQSSSSARGPRSYLDVRVVGADDYGPQRVGSLRQPTGSNDNALVIEDLAPGRYWLRVRSSRGYVAAANAGGIDLLHEPLIVASGITPVEITMHDDTAQIAGTVTGIAGMSAASRGPADSPGASSNPAYVYCVPLLDGPGQFQQLPVSPDGKFNSQAMAPGSYRVLAFKNPQPLPYQDAEAMRAYDALGQVVHLAAGQKESVDLQIISSGDQP
jgi:hypothetical protein